MPEYKPFNQLGTTLIKVPMYMKTECIHPYSTFPYRGALYLPAADTLLQHKIKIVFLKFSEFPLGNGNNMPFYFDVPRLDDMDGFLIDNISFSGGYKLMRHYFIQHLLQPCKRPSCRNEGTVF